MENDRRTLRWYEHTRFGGIFRDIGRHFGPFRAGRKTPSALLSVLNNVDDEDHFDGHMVVAGGNILLGGLESSGSRRFRRDDRAIGTVLHDGARWCSSSRIRHFADHIFRFYAKIAD